MRAVHENGVARRVRGGGPYGLVLANILARPLCAMARPLAATLAPGAGMVSAGLLCTRPSQVAAAWRRQGVVLRRIAEGRWTTLVLQAPWERALTLSPEATTATPGRAGDRRVVRIPWGKGSGRWRRAQGRRCGARKRQRLDAARCAGRIAAAAPVA